MSEEPLEVVSQDSDEDTPCNPWRFLSSSEIESILETLRSKESLHYYSLSEEEKKAQIAGFHSEESRAKSSVARSEGLSRSWARLTEGELKARGKAISEGLAKVKDQHSESMEAYWATKSEEERRLHYSKSFGKPEAQKKCAEASSRAWAGYTPEERQARIDNEIQSEKARLGRIKHYNDLSEEDKSEWVRVHLRSSGHKKTYDESICESFLNVNYPGMWGYNGSGPESKLVGGKRPDFLYLSGKFIIEVFGSEFWHSEEEIPILIEYYKSLGYECLVLWGYECDFWEELKVRIDEWMKGFLSDAAANP